MLFSLIIPVYNRPEEVEELLESLTKQTAQNFEIVIVEDGSKVDCKTIVDNYSNNLTINYFFKENGGPGPARNYGAERAKGDYFIFFDSDCIIPEKYMEIVERELNKNYVDAFGGPDMAHPSFSPTQKAINYSMTSFFTTGGIRGGKKKIDVFHPRSFNMGISRKVYQTTKGFAPMRFGEDVDFSLRIIKAGFSTRLIIDAAVYHKRRTDFKKFFKQVFNSGIARINLYKRHPKSLKIVHALPSIFLVGSIFIVLISIFCPLFLSLFLIYAIIIFIDSFMLNKNIEVAFLSIIASFVQLWSYGTGFLLSAWRRIILKRDEFHAFKKNFYK